MTMYEKLEQIAKENTLPITAENADGEMVVIEIQKYIEGKPIFKTMTAQNNDWLRTNIYHPDGCCEEMYER